MISGRYPKNYRLRKSSQFQSLSRNSNVFYGEVLFVVWKTNSLTHARLGITVTKKFGDAHIRNRFKRLVREAFRTSRVKNFAVDIHVKPKGKNVALPLYEQVAKDFATLHTKLGS